MATNSCRRLVALALVATCVLVATSCDRERCGMIGLVDPYRVEVSDLASRRCQDVEIRRQPPAGSTFSAIGCGRAALIECTCPNERPPLDGCHSPRCRVVCERGWSQPDPKQWSRPPPHPDLPLDKGGIARRAAAAYEEHDYVGAARTYAALLDALPATQANRLERENVVLLTLRLYSVAIEDPRPDKPSSAVLAGEAHGVLAHYQDEHRRAYRRAARKDVIQAARWIDAALRGDAASSLTCE